MNLKKTIYNNLAFKIVAVLLAILLWLYVYFVFGAKTTKTASIKIQVEGLNPAYEVSLSQDNVQVTFSAPIQQIEQIEKSIRATMDLSNIGPGKFNKKPKIVTPKDTTILLQSPAEIEVNVESIMTKEFTIKPSFKGKIQPGTTLGEIDLKPSKLSLKGTATLLKDISVVVEIDVSNAVSDLFGYAEVKIFNLKNEEIKTIPIPSKAVYFHIPILSTDIVKTVPIIPDFIGSAPYAILSFSINPTMITLKGNAKDLETIQSIKTKPIDLSLINENSTMEVNLVLPTGVKQEKIDEMIVISLKTEPIITRTIPNVTIQLKNNSFASVLMAFEQCQVTLIGRKSLIEKMTIPSIFVDLKNATIGTKEYVLQSSELPLGIFLQVTPKKMEIKILD